MGPDERGAAPDKAALRTELLATRRARSPEELTRARAAVREHVLEHVVGVARVAAYEPMRTEPGSSELLAALHAQGVTVLVPVTLPDSDLDWTEWSPAGPGAPLGVDAISPAGRWPSIGYGARSCARRDATRTGWRVVRPGARAVCRGHGARGVGL